MELLGGRVPFTQFQEEKYQMLELNQRLESYLGHVKLLEEENKLLREEVHTLKSSKEPPGQRKAQEEALSQARRMLEEAWRKKDCVVMEVENLMEDIEVVSIQRQKAKNAKAEAQRKLMESRKELEEERRAQIWLREKSGQLEKDLLLQMQVHQENMETLHDSLKQTKQVLMTPQPTQTTSIPDLGQEYSYRAAQAWQEATNNYQRLVGRLEESLNQAKANMAKIHQEKRENQHQVQHLAKELESTKTKRQMLEKNVVQQREEHTQELQYLQAQVDALELEKDSLGQQIDSLMVDRQNLLQVKMSLGMEVVTYRALLDSEGQRIDRPTTKMTSSAFFLDVFSKPTGTQPASQTTAASCHVSNTVSTRHRSITSSHTLLTRATPSWTPTRGTPQRTPTSTSVTEKTKVHISEQTEKAAEESVDHVQQEKVHEDMVLKTTLPAAEPEPQLKPEDSEIKEDETIQFMKAQMVECKTDASALISVSADQPSNLSQTSETEIWAGPFTDPAGDSEEKKHEDTEVSFVMAQITCAPKVACEENKTIADYEKDDACKMDVRSENISESHTFAYGDAENNDDDALKSSHISANTSIMGSSFLEQGTLDMAGDFGYHEDLMTVDKQDNVSNISEEGREQMNSGTDAVIDSMKEMDRQEEIEPENEMKVVSPDSEEEEQDEMNIDADTKFTKEDEYLTEIEEEEIEVIKSDFSVLDEGVDSPKNSDHQESLEKTVLPTEPHSDQTVNEEDPSKPEDTEIKENEPILFTKAQMVECKTDASALISVSADKPSNLSQTSETEIWAGPFTDPAGDSEEKKDEDTEVSFVMAQISRAPKVACEENKTIAKDKNIDNSEIDVRSENISESHTFAYGDAENHDDDDALKSSHISTHTSIMGSSFLEQGTLDMAGDFAYHEDLMTVDTQDNVSNISEEGKEQMNSGTEAVIDSMKEMDRQEEIEPENEMKVVSPDSVEEEEDEMNIDADTKVTKEDTNVTEIEEEEIEVIKSDFSVPDEVVDSSMNSDHQESLEKTVLPTEPHSDQTVNEEDPSKPEDPEIKENEPIQFMKAQMVECKTDASTFISASADQPSNLSQTSETEIWAGPFTDPAGDSEEGKHEDTEVSFEMAQISRAPKVACEENITIAKDENDDTFEIDVRSENISESHTFAYGDAENNDDDALKSSHISANTSIMGSSFLEQGTLDMAGDFGYHEDLMTVDKQDNVSNISEEGKEQMNSGTDAAIDSVKEMDRQEEIEPENEMKVVSPDSEEEEEDEMNIDADTKVTKEDTNVTEIEEEEIEVIKIKSDFSVLDEGVDSSMNSDHQESLEKTVLPTEPHSDQTVNEEESFPEEAVGEEENQGEDDDSPNIAFCRNDPGECDSYSPENTLADTRPLIHHKSDEETKGNVQASHLIGETSDSEGEKERMEGANLKEGASKHFNTMEDLTEEPDMEVTGEMVTEDNVSKEEVQDSDMTCIKPQSDSEVHERIELKGNLEEHSDFITEMRKAEDHDVKAYEQPQLTENQHMHTEQPEDETVHSYESQEHPISFPETSHQLKNLFETPSTLTMFQDAAATKNSEDLMEASMHTNVDLKLSRSLESKISSQPDSMTSDIPNSDQEEGNSSEDESPNASQCFQSTSLLTVATLKKLPFTFTNGVSKADSVSDVNYLPEEALSKEKNTEEPKTPQTDDWENSDIWSKSMNAPDATEIMHASSMDENTGVFQVNETESLEISNKTAENIFGKFEEQFERTLESFSEKVLSVMDCESTSSGENEEFQSKEKKSEIHSFFSTSMKEDFWSQGKLEMVATYDPAKTEDLDQAMVFGEEWRDMERMPTENLSPKEKMAILEGQEEKHKDKKPAQGKMVLSDDSVDEGDSWSSGDE
ncbi:nestin-like isoform X10 [Carassius gibelio]|uniref:nestin-like isoform X10 n=1 Tax=Carassius gibelio TaxID=101364 RepID=UPI00227810C6|nr:nestin-like isoform X10 [Carassius gibelio]